MAGERIIPITGAQVAKAIDALISERDWHIAHGAKLTEAILSIKVLTEQPNFTAKKVRSIATKALR